MAFARPPRVIESTRRSRKRAPTRTTRHDPRCWRPHRAAGPGRLTPAEETTMPGLVIKGVSEDVPDLSCTSWLDDPALRLKMGEDGAPRPPNTWIRAIVLHTTRGIPGGTDTRPQKIL